MWCLAGPATTRSIASSSVAWSICPRPSRTLSSAASLITFASSAPLKPGVWRATSSSEASGASGRLPPCRRRISRRPCTSGDVDHDLAVEAPGAQQRRVEDVGAVGGAHHHQPAVAGEAVHLDEDLVERLLALVVALPDAGAALAPGGVELVDEDDRRRRLARLAEQVAHAGRADADERLDEVRARQREEGRVGFAGDGLGEQRLAGPGGPDQQHALRRGRADRQVLARVGQVVADLAKLGDRLAGAGDVGEGDPVGGALALLAGPCR